MGIFRSIAAPRRLSRIVEGESLLNDAAAIALFGLFMGFVMLGVPDPNLGGALARFPLLMVGGAFTGWVAGTAGRRRDGTLSRGTTRAQISISVALPYLAYIGAEQCVGASGVIAVVVVGPDAEPHGAGAAAAAAWTALREVWDLLAHWAGALIFVLAALLIPRLLEGVSLARLRPRSSSSSWPRSRRGRVVLFGLLPLLTLLRRLAA